MTFSVLISLFIVPIKFSDIRFVLQKIIREFHHFLPLIRIILLYKLHDVISEYTF